jgi:hypothetical protein
MIALIAMLFTITSMVLAYIMHVWVATGKMYSTLPNDQLPSLPRRRFEVYAYTDNGEGVRVGVMCPSKNTYPPFAEAKRCKNQPMPNPSYLRIAVIEDVMDTVAIAEAIEAAKDLAQRCNDYTDERDRQMAMIAERVREANER